MKSEFERGVEFGRILSMLCTGVSELAAECDASSEKMVRELAARMDMVFRKTSGAPDGSVRFVISKKPEGERAKFRAMSGWLPLPPHPVQD